MADNNTIAWPYAQAAFQVAVETGALGDLSASLNTAKTLLDDGRVVMERIYRYTVGRTLLECPSGGLDGEDAETAARRELEEETGYVAAEIRRLGTFYGSTGISNERYHVCLATGLREDGEIRREATEQIEVCLLPLGELRERAARGELEDGPSAFAILLAARELDG